MKIQNNILYIEFADFIAAGWKEDTIKKANLRNGYNWQMVKNPADLRRPMVQYETLVPAHQEKLQAWLRKKSNCRHFGEACECGNPNIYMAKQPIKDLVITDAKAEAFYTGHSFNLPKETIDKYTVAASWLNMLVKTDADKNLIKKTLKLSVDTFYNNVTEIIDAENIALPSSYRRLRAKMAEYATAGYETLVDWRFGNKLAAKIGKTTDGYNEDIARQQIALIREAARKHNNFDAMQILGFVNPIFLKNGWPSVSHGTVYNIVKANEHLTTSGSRGVRAYNNTIAMQVKRARPDAPLKYFTLDGWTVELLYQDETGYNNRLVVVVVLDAMNNYPVGFAIGERENADLIRQANKNALLHIRDLFGTYYRPWQLQSDNYAIKNLTPFYQAVSKLHTPAAVGNAKSKVIEPYFKDLNKKYCQTQYNWSGFNVTSKKTNQPNVEYLDKIKKQLPFKEDVISQIEAIIAQERSIKVAEYTAKFNALPEADKAQLTQIDWLMVFGTPHTHTNTISGEGLTPTLLNQKRWYDTFDPHFRALQNLDWRVIYDADNLNEVLAVSTCGKHKFLLQEKRLVPMDVRSAKPEDHTYRSQIYQFNKDRRKEVIETYIKDAQLVHSVIENTPLSLTDFNEANLKLMFTNGGQQKEGIQDAKGLKAIKKKEQKQLAAAIQVEQNDFQQQQLEYLKSKTDFNQYLD